MSPLVTAQWLHSQLNDRQNLDIAIVDCRFALANADLGRQQYDTAHIPGAYYFDLNRDLSSPIQTHGGRHPLPDENILGAKLAAIGIKYQQTLVVVYDDSRFAFASRLWWLLRYYGHQNVVVLDGGYSNWLKAGYPVTATQPTPSEPGNFQPQLQADWIVDINQVKAIQHTSTHILIDSREPDRYSGKTEPIDPIAGHIPSAVNYPWQDVSTPEGFAYSIDRQQQRWAAINPNLEPIVYCGSGVTACVNLLSLELAGIPSAKLYPGSWSDWCSFRG
jgi:thiosulfate/3-mercaptopyruvate sulfurtransferase